ncbi:hypothetical protein F2Q69_00027675 [Brassica cretica]|uniref:Uncharacterized protein n=1 Tax=Brassica cretica TaxID=69181 RepID=A0A8S9RWN4_BRACR|nr:hypothetical protein F2Q69_00027675 [Brassica cretica]
MVIQGENQKLSLHQALSLETLFADHLLLIAYEDRRGGSCYRKNEIARKNGNQAAHEELMRSPAVDDDGYLSSERVSGGLLPKLYSGNIDVSSRVTRNVCFQICKKFIHYIFYR